MNVKFLGRGEREAGGQGCRLSQAIWAALPWPCPGRHLVEAAVGQAGVLLVLRPNVGGCEAVAFPVDVFPKAQGRYLWSGAGVQLSTEGSRGAQPLAEPGACPS